MDCSLSMDSQGKNTVWSLASSRDLLDLGIEPLSYVYSLHWQVVLNTSTMHGKPDGLISVAQ